MDINAITECTALSLAEQISFPEVVMKLSAAGVERYIVDLAGQKKFTYGTQGETHLGELKFPAVAIAEEFDAVAIKQAIRDSQQGRIQYQEFLRRVMEAGCSHYEVFLTGRRAIYSGRKGCQHIEEFPKAA